LFLKSYIYNYTKNLNQFFEASVATGNKWTNFEKWVPKVFGSTSGGALFGKGVTDAAVAYAYNDRVCFVISCIGCAFDFLQFLASFVPGPNVTVIVTLTGSAACKTFVWACKNQTLSWKAGCS
jgi:hypothetical protein